MPTLNLKVAPLLNPPQYSALASALTCLTVLHLGKREAVTAVMIDDLPVARWYIAGRSVQRATALLEVSITSGTNTVEQKEAFIAAAYTELQAQLGNGRPLEEASYVIVREVAGTDWGYSGVSQTARHKQLSGVNV